MNPWLRELVRTLAVIAVEDALAREEKGRGVTVEVCEPDESADARVRQRVDRERSDLPSVY